MSTDDQPDQLVCFGCQTPIDGSAYPERGEWFHRGCVPLPRGGSS